MHDHLRHLIIGSSLVLGACDYEDELELDQPEPTQPTEHASADEVAAENSAELREQDGLDPDCVDVTAPIIVRIDPFTTTCKFANFEALFGDTFESVALFDDGSPMLVGLPGALPVNSPLRQFCRYDYIGNAVDPYPDYVDFMVHLKGADVPPGVDGGSAAIDCPVIAPMAPGGGLDTPEARLGMHHAFMDNIDAVSADDLAGITRHAMTLVLLDTVAQGVAPYNEHGLLLEKLIADIACPGDTTTCMHWIQHVLVTPRVPEDDFSTADWSGGNVGYMHEFSMGLAFALLDWSSTNLTLPLANRKRLVVSAAVGADPNHPIASDPAYAPAQSAIVALQAAYCLGATVYAAAGNTRDNSCPNEETEMLAPASYESLAVPTATQCTSWGYLPDNGSYTYAPGSPLIQAVGGLRGGDVPIANHRRDAHPRLHATASDAISSDGTVAITGTSVATAVAAATHLLRWSIQPNQSGASVATHLYNTGYATGEDADDGMYINLPIRRLGVCHAVEDMLKNGCGSLAPNPDNFEEYTLAIEDAIDLADDFELLIGPSETLDGDEPDCSVGPTFDDFIHPQPERPACSNCNGILNGAGGDHMLNMSIYEQTWVDNLTVTGAFLHTYDAGGSATTFDLATVVPSINLAEPANIIQVPFGGAVPASAVLEFVYYNASNGKTTKVSNTIPLLWPV